MIKVEDFDLTKAIPIYVGPDLFLYSLIILKSKVETTRYPNLVTDLDGNTYRFNSWSHSSYCLDTSNILSPDSATYDLVDTSDEALAMLAVSHQESHRLRAEAIINFRESNQDEQKFYRSLLSP